MCVTKDMLTITQVFVSFPVLSASLNPAAGKLKQVFMPELDAFPVRALGCDSTRPPPSAAPQPLATVIQPFTAKHCLSIHTLLLVPCSLQARTMAACRAAARRKPERVFTVSQSAEQYS